MTTQHESVDTRILKWGAAASFLLLIAAFVTGGPAPLATYGDHTPVLSAHAVETSTSTTRSTIGL